MKYEHTIDFTTGDGLGVLPLKPVNGVSTEDTRALIRKLIARCPDGCKNLHVALLPLGKNSWAFRIMQKVDNTTKTLVSEEFLDARSGSTLFMAKALAWAEAGTVIVETRIPAYSRREDLIPWVISMSRQCLMFHPDDDPADVIRSLTGEPLFTPWECGVLRQQIEKMRVDWEDDLYVVLNAFAAGFGRDGFGVGPKEAGKAVLYSEEEEKRIHDYFTEQVKQAAVLLASIKDTVNAEGPGYPTVSQAHLLTILADRTATRDVLSHLEPVLEDPPPRKTRIADRLHGIINDMIRSNVGTFSSAYHASVHKSASHYLRALENPSGISSKVSY